jgi:hypothetical protein
VAGGGCGSTGGRPGERRGGCYASDQLLGGRILSGTTLPRWMRPPWSSSHPDPPADELILAGSEAGVEGGEGGLVEAVGECGGHNGAGTWL